jgi:hypothetical protein
MARLRSLDSLSRTPTIRSNTCGGGPSIDSNATVGPSLPAIANEPLAAPPLAQPPRPQANVSRTAAMAARGAVIARNKVAELSLIAPERYR